MPFELQRADPLRLFRRDLPLHVGELPLPRSFFAMRLAVGGVQLVERAAHRAATSSGSSISVGIGVDRSASTL